MKTAVICHICNFKPEYGGSFVDSLSLYLNQDCRNTLGLGIFCIFPEQAKTRQWLSQLDKAGIRYGFVPMKKHIASHIRLVLHDYNPIIFHTHFFLYDLSALVMKCLVYRTSKVVWHCHGPIARTLKQRTKNLLKIKLAFRYWGDRCIAVGDGVYQSLIDSGFSRETAVLIHNGVNASRFLYNGEARNDTRRSLGVSNEHTIFLLLGWDPIRKGVDVFIKAAEETLRQNDTKSMFLIIGKAATKEFVSQFLSKSNLSDTLRVIDPIEDISLLLNGVDVLVSASRREGLSYAVLEAMTAGNLILSSDIPSVRETYGASEGVWLFPTEDWEALSALMKRAATLSISERKFISRANSQYVQKHYLLEHWAKKVAQLYKEILRT